MPTERPAVIDKLPSLDASRRLVVIPISERNMLDVPTTPLFSSKLPVVTRMFGVPIGRDTSTRRQEAVVVTRIDNAQGQEPYIARISEDGSYPHNRSINYMYAGDTTAEQIEIAGHVYSGISSKGADFVYPELVHDPNYPHDFRIEGLVTEDFAKSIVKVSNWLLSVGISAEVIWSVSRLDKLPLKKQTFPLKKDATAPDFVDLVTPKEFKKALINQAEVSNARSKPEDKIDLKKAKRYLSRTDFVVVNRATEVPFRLSDLIVPFYAFDAKERVENFAFMMNRIFSHLNTKRDPNDLLRYLQISDQTGQPELKDWNESLLKYFTYFATNLGTQIGSLHKHNVTHNSLHGGNIVADGSFCDIDSLEGLPLGEPAITAKRAAKDIFYALTGIDSTTFALAHQGIISKDQVDFIRATFLKQYIATRWKQPPLQWEPDFTPSELKSDTARYVHDWQIVEDPSMPSYKQELVTALNEFDSNS